MFCASSWLITRMIFSCLAVFCLLSILSLITFLLSMQHKVYLHTDCGVGHICVLSRPSEPTVTNCFHTFCLKSLIINTHYVINLLTYEGAQLVAACSTDHTVVSFSLCDWQASCLGG